MQIFRLSTARMKVSQIIYVNFQATSQFSFKFCIAFQFYDTEFLSVKAQNKKFRWNFLAKWLHFGQKEPFKVQNLRLLCALMKVHLIPHASFEITRSRFIHIFHHCSVSWKITPLYFFSSNLYTLDEKQFSEWLGKNSQNSLWHVRNNKSVFI